MENPSQGLADAYRSVGAAISELRSMPIRRYSDDEEAFRVRAAQTYLLEAQAYLDTALCALERPPILIGPEPTRQGALRLFLRPTIYVQIGELHAVREKIGRELAGLQHPCPDDLPKGGPFERFCKRVGFRKGLIVAFFIVLAIVIVTSVTSVSLAIALTK